MSDKGMDRLVGRTVAIGAALVKQESSEQPRGDPRKLSLSRYLLYGSSSVS